MFGLFKMTRKKVARQARGGDLVAKKLAGLDLSGLSFKGTDFKGADLTGTDLSRTEFSECDLERAKLARVEVGGATFTACRLPRAFKDALARANIVRAGCSAAVMRGRST